MQQKVNKFFDDSIELPEMWCEYFVHLVNIKVGKRNTIREYAFFFLKFVYNLFK